jgi:hypothetical protein
MSRTVSDGQPFWLDSSSLLTYMSIRERIRAVLGKELYCLPPDDGGECVRTIFASNEVFESVRGPFPENFDGYRLGRLRGTLDTFTKGKWVSIATNPYSKQPSAYVAPVGPIELGIWDIRSISPKPEIRCFGAWAEKDTFVALTWRWRDYIEKFSEEASECRAEWDRIFASYLPFKGNTIDDYIKERYRVV